MKPFIKIAILKVFKTTLLKYLGSTLVIMYSNEEPNCLFGGMAVPQWKSS